MFLDMYLKYAYNVDFAQDVQSANDQQSLP